MSYFKDRYHAGRLLADALRSYKAHPKALVLGIPRGGVPVAYEIAKALGLPLDIFLVRKLGVPGHEELAMGAISSGGGQFLNIPVVDALGLEPTTIEAVANRELKTLQKREALYRREREALPLADRELILVDDGLATGSTMLAGIQALRHLNPLKIIVAVPVAPADTALEVAAACDEWHCLNIADPFFSVGQWYDDFTQIEDAEVMQLLHHSTQDFGELHARDASPWGERQPAS